jgi:hypothetical protein
LRIDQPRRHQWHRWRERRRLLEAKIRRRRSVDLVKAEGSGGATGRAAPMQRVQHGIVAEVRR